MLHCDVKQNPNRPINSDTIPLRIVIPSSTQRAGLCDKQKITNTIFSHLQPARSAIFPKLCTVIEDVETIIKVESFVSIQCIVFPVGMVECSRRPGLRSADTADYVKHRLQSKFGERCFSYAGPAAWNSLPHSIKLITSTTLYRRFKQLLKFHLFHIAF